FDLAHEYSQALSAIEAQQEETRLRELRILLEAGDFEKAIEDFKSFPSGVQPQAYQLFQTYLAKIFKDQLQEIYLKILRSDPDQDLSMVEIMLLMQYLKQPGSDNKQAYLFAPHFEKQFDQLPVSLQVEIAQLFLKAGGDEVAEEYFQKILENDPRQKDAIVGLARIAFKKKDLLKAKEGVDQILKEDPQHFDALFLKGEIYEGFQDYWNAAKVYDEIIKRYPENRAAFNLKLRALMDLGATSLVIDEAQRQDSKVDPVIALRAQGNVPMQQIQWEEYQQALPQLERLIEQYRHLREIDSANQEVQLQYWRSRWDRMTALRAQDQMRDVIQEYQLVQQESVEIPIWIHAAAADAYLYEQQPEKALEIYDAVLKKNPMSYEVRMAKYDTLVELERFEDAQKVLEKLDEETPKTTTERGSIEPNWKKARIAYDKGWLLMYQDRLKEGEQYLQQIADAAPFNTNILTAQAHKDLWRGWPRRALRDFQIIRTMDPTHVQAQIGYANALNANGYKKEARKEVASLLEKHPKNKHVQRSKRLFDVEEMTIFGLDASYREEFPGEDEFQITLRLDEPVTFRHNLFVEMTRRETTDPVDDVVQRKIYVGDQWQVNRAIRLVGAISGDYETGKDVGGLGRITLTPDDHWNFDVGFEKNILSVPIRSRAQGVDVDEYTFSTMFRGSELWETRVGFSLKDFDDGNDNWNYYWRTRQTWMTKAAWKLRLDTEFNVSTFSRQDVDYFSPEHLYSVYLIPNVEHIWFRRYQKALIDRFYVGLGQVWQKNFDSQNLGFVRYEQDYRFSDLLSFLWGVRYDLNQYDGDDVNALMFYTSLRVKF
ncbi:MAG: tetratricopeptide repeat protein, partial [Candidatus Omnitrophica bacterium]|nr:tetratricopeptide repeat protein [Candidatus Omnitrophota bacterium]